ncbi:MAG: FecR domain-containing protein [Bdellovibrio sp.]|nr:FecR domain-containing protein [Bdellovibrio sp.]
MKSFTMRQFSNAILMFFLVFSFHFFAQAGSGQFLIVKGEVKVKKADDQMQVAKVGLKVVPGDTIISGVDSRAKIVMSDRNVISISPSTTLKIEKYSTEKDKDDKNVELSLSEGKVRSDVKQEYDGEKTKYLIRTPTAVAGVRGTQFITSFDSKTNVTEVITLTGKVAFTSIATSSMVEVGKGQSSSMKKDQSPEAPKIVPSDTLKSIDLEAGGKESKDKDSKGKDKGAVDRRDVGAGGAQDIVMPPPNAAPPVPPPPPPPPPATPKNPSTKTKVKVVPTTGAGGS